MNVHNLERKYDGIIPQAELDRVEGREPAAIRRARAVIRFYEREESAALDAMTLWDAASQAGKTLDYDEDTFRSLNDRFNDRVACARRNLATFRALLAQTIIQIYGYPEASND